MRVLLTTILVVFSVVAVLSVLFVCYFKITRKGTWSEAFAQAMSDILM